MKRSKGGGAEEERQAANRFRGHVFPRWRCLCRKRKGIKDIGENTEEGDKDKDCGESNEECDNTGNNEDKINETKDEFQMN